MTSAEFDEKIERVKIDFAVDWLAAMKTEGVPWDEIEKALRSHEWLLDYAIKGLREKERSSN